MENRHLPILHKNISVSSVSRTSPTFLGRVGGEKSFSKIDLLQPSQSLYVFWKNHLSLIVADGQRKDFLEFPFHRSKRDVRTQQDSLRAYFIDEVHDGPWARQGGIKIDILSAFELLQEV